MSRRIQALFSQRGTDIIAEYSAGESIQALAVKYRVSLVTLRSWLKERSTVGKSKCKDGELRRRRCKVRELYAAGALPEFIATRLSVSLQTVLRDLKVILRAEQIEHKPTVEIVETPVRNELKEATGICYVWRNDGVMSR
jgi:transposase